MNSFAPFGGSIVSVAVLLAIAIPSDIRAQTASQPRFDVSTIRTSDPGAGRGTTLSANGDSLRGHNITLMMLIRMAYGLNDDQISGGPDWISSRRFDISAKTDTPMDPTLKPEAAQTWQRQVFKQLLAERFQLRLHHETKDMPGYQLVVSKNGPRGLQADDTNGPALSVTDGKLHATAASMDQLALVLEQRLIEAPVKNMTGLSGKFDIDLTFDPKQTRNASAADAATDNVPSIFVALQQQLGLRLEPHKTPADSVVIESAQLPQEN